MCIRYSVNSESLFAWSLSLGIWVPTPELFGSEDRFPGYHGPFVANSNNRMRMFDGEWGLIPRWSRDRYFGTKFAVNARAEGNERSPGIEHTPTFREAFRLRRCLIPMTGFYERKDGYWHRFTGAESDVLAVAGVWEPPHLTSVPTYSLITTEPNELVLPYQDRMPVILTPDSFDLWLDPHAAVARLKALLRPLSSDQMQVQRVEATSSGQASFDFESVD